MNKKLGIGKTAFSLLLGVALIACEGSGDGNSSSGSLSNDAPTFEITSRLITEFGTDAHEAWTCIDRAGEAALFTFYRQGAVAGLGRMQLGMQYSVRSNEPEFKYMWSAIDNASVVLQSPPLGLQDSWTNIEFSETGESPRLMKAISAAKGALYCSLEGEAS